MLVAGRSGALVLRRPCALIARAQRPLSLSRAFASSVTSTETPINDNNNKKKKRRFLPLKIAASVCAIGAIAYLGDLVLNDDLDIITERFRTRLTPEERADRPRVVILGAGWAALSMLRKLQTDKFNVTIVSPRNYFLFTPLLASTTSGTVEFKSIIEPIRNYCARSAAPEVEFLEAECIDIDPVTKQIKCADVSKVQGSVNEFNLPYDELIVAVGADVATFNVPGVKENALYMKEISDSRSIRDRVLDCFETASYPGQPSSEIDRLLHFVVVGGGPSGVEFTAELDDFLHSDLVKAFPKLADRVKITLVEALPHILSVFDATVIDYVEKKFQTSQNIEVWTKTSVTGIEDTKLTVKRADGTVEQVPYGALVWATGNTPRKLVQDLIKKIGPESQNCRRGLAVDDYFRVKGANGIWSLGDCSCTNLPATAQVASQEGRYLGRLFNSSAEDMNALKHAPGKYALDAVLTNFGSFTYHNFGKFAYIGGHQAVAEFDGDKSKVARTNKGWVTFMLWRSVYLSKLLSVKNRVLVSFDWCKTAIFGRDISRS